MNKEGSHAVRHDSDGHFRTSLAHSQNYDCLLLQLKEPKSAGTSVGATESRNDPQGSLVKYHHRYMVEPHASVQAYG
jgi:hypothetical protein